jgi:hypothetical protein
MPDSLLIAYRDFGWGGVRPYLVLHVTGINGASGLIPGLLDTGADSTVLPAGYAPLMGYTASDLETKQGTQVGGSVTLKTRKHHAEHTSLRFQIWSSTYDHALSRGARMPFGVALIF